MNKSPLLLSICIPTYNRAEYLKVAIKSIIEQEGFDERTEIVIVDNCSTDNTLLVVNEFMMRYNNIKYYCNENNIGLEANILRALELGKGSFLKLLNDYITFKPNILNSLIYLIELKQKSGADIFYLNGNLLKNDEINNDYSQFNSADSFIAHVSYWTTWITCFGVWKSKFEQISNKEKYLGLLFFHNVLLFDILKSNVNIIVDNRVLFEIQRVQNKSGYDLFFTFVNNYKKLILHKFFTDGYIQKNTYVNVSNDLLRRFILPRFKTLFIQSSKNYEFNTNKALRLIFYEYKNSFYFYWKITLFILQKYITNIFKYVFGKRLMNPFFNLLKMARL